MLFDKDPESAEQYPYMHQYTNYMKRMTRPLVGREHEMQQVMAAMLKPEYCNVLLLGEAGSGKAIANGTPIAVNDARGYVPIEQLVPGDLVFDENGDPTEVLGVYPQGLKHAYRVSFFNGSSCVCNDEHIWNVRRYDIDTYSDLTLREMMDDGIESDGRHKLTRKWRVPRAKGVKRVVSGMHSDDWALDGYGLAMRVRDGSHDVVPDQVIAASYADRADFLEGLEDGFDGSRIEGPKAFIESVCWLYRSMGEHFVLAECDADGGSSRYFVDEHAVRDPDGYLDGLAIDSVEDLGYDCAMTCIYVAAASHLFQVGHEHIVTHNTALVQGIMVTDTDRMYLEVDLSKMIANLKNENEMADRLKTLFDEVSRFKNAREKEIVLFIDEFHQIVQLSPAAVEVLKPLLADSGTRGIRVIAATTHVEYQQFIAPNLPLVERLQRIKLVQPGEEVVVSILKSMCERYGVRPSSPELFSEIYTYTNRYIPATSQPRKSILILDSMIGWHRLTQRPLDRRLLADVIYETEGINVAFRVDAASIKKRLDEKVLAQQVATSSIEQRMQIAVAGLNNPNRPMSSFLFCGSTGVGKSNVCSTKIRVWTPDGSVSCKLAGDIVPGDYIFDREGHPTKVLGVFPQGRRRVYRVTLGDGRYLDVSDNHLWAVFPSRRSRDEGYTIYDTKTLINKGLVTHFKGREAMKYVIPMNHAVEWPARDFAVDPYVIGVAIGDGSLSCESRFVISSDDEFVISKVASLLGAAGYKKDATGYDWSFQTGETARNGKAACISQADVVGNIPQLFHVKSPKRRIPRDYMTGSVAQRWALVNGLFDTDGTICQSDGDRFNISYSTHSEGLAYDVQELLYSLGVPSSVSKHERDGKNPEYDVHVKSRNADKPRFFTLPKKKDIAEKAVGVNKQREKMFDYVGIRSIEDMGYDEEMVCFYVDNDEHLYQAGDFIVTHNTEATKQLAAILYDDDRNLIRFDMTEFALPDSLNRFRRELTNRVSTIPYCLILLDEIEKACAPVTRVLLQVLDDGRLMDENEREVTFKNAYIIVTTNSGSEIFKTISNYEQSDKADFKMLEKYDKLLRESIRSQSGSKFPPELLGRIDCIVPFQPLSRKTMANIIQMKLRQLSATVRQKHGVNLHVHKNIYVYMIFDKLDADSDSGGARIVVSKLEREVTVPLSRYINEHPMEKEVFVSIGGNMAVMNKRQLESEAYVYVGPKFLNEDKDMNEALKS